MNDKQKTAIFRNPFVLLFFLWAIKNGTNISPETCGGRGDYSKIKAWMRDNAMRETQINAMIQLFQEDGGMCDCTVMLNTWFYCEKRIYSIFKQWALFAALVIIFLALTLSGCGSIERELSAAAPDITILNLVPGGTNPADCPDCPQGMNVTAFRVGETAGGDWGVALQVDGKCPVASVLINVKLSLFYEQSNGTWNSFTGDPADYPFPECIGTALVWYPMAQPCPGESWCTLPDPWVSLDFEDFNGFHYQLFARPEPLDLGGF